MGCIHNESSQNRQEFEMEGVFSGMSRRKIAWCCGSHLAVEGEGKECSQVGRLTVIDPPVVFRRHAMRNLTSASAIPPIFSSPAAAAALFMFSLSDMMTWLTLLEEVYVDLS
jgi:hypothetical protein